MRRDTLFEDLLAFLCGNAETVNHNLSDTAEKAVVNQSINRDEELEIEQGTSITEKQSVFNNMVDITVDSRIEAKGLRKSDEVKREMQIANSYIGRQNACALDRGVMDEKKDRDATKRREILEKQVKRLTALKNATM